MITLALLLLSPLAPQDDPKPPELSTDDLASFAKVAELEFSAAELEAMLRSVGMRRGAYRQMRAATLDNGDPPATVFDPFLPGMQSRAHVYPPGMVHLPQARRPDDLGELYWAGIPTLAQLVRTRQVSCVELTSLFLDRLEALDEHLHLVISLRREQALARARELDGELEQGKWRGMLHGIPWGAKDLLATRDSPTTWGAQPYREQVLDLDATVVERLDAAGAVLVAKLSLGALAMGDRWYGERTRTPWDPERGSSGSSAGPASAVAAGGLPFTIGSETLGSIVSPSVQCGSTALRPTFGRVSRYGAMTLCWSMDKLGPMARSARDCAIVFATIQGPDGRDPSVRDVPFVWPGPTSVKGLRVGYPKGAFGQTPLEHHTLVELAGLGVELVEVELPAFPEGIVGVILATEAATAFDAFTRGGLDDQLVSQGPRAWPNYFRSARLIPAVEFLRAQRLRARLMLDLHRTLANVDLLVHPPYHGGILGMTNLTGHPTFVAPSGFVERDGKRVPEVVCFTGQLDDDARLLVLAQAWQAATPWEDEHPPMEWLAR
jgi:Asp-tRNA(Asn)/Glu-tRNA(Gln) amidotransferase A subunit family amidase